MSGKRDCGQPHELMGLGVGGVGFRENAANRVRARELCVCVRARALRRADSSSYYQLAGR